MNFFHTLQSGMPIPVTMESGQLADGAQRPNLTGNPRSGFSISDVVDGKGNFFNVKAFSDAGDQKPGNAPRFLDAVGHRMNELNFSLFKVVSLGEKAKLQLRAEFFNFTNTPRFGQPGGLFGSGDFGTINSQLNSPRRTQMGVRFVF